MRRIIHVVIVALAFASTSYAARDDAPGDQEGRREIHQLIADLGSDEYAVRRRAEEQLLRLGPEAFDELKSAEDHRDLEIAERVRYIVQRMRVEWIRPDDPPDVRRLLARYADLSESARTERIRRLSNADDGAGLAALCRIARFDQSTLVARRAAMEILGLKLSAEQRRTAGAAWLRELGGSERAPVQWIKLYLRELDDPEEAINDWAEAAKAEARLLEADVGDTDLRTAFDLVSRLLDRCFELNLPEQTATALFTAVDLLGGGDADQRERGLAWALEWTVKHPNWDVLELVEKRFEDQLRRDRQLLYYFAAAASRAGRHERASELAAHAFALAGDDEDERVLIASALAEFGFVDWAEREYRRTIEVTPIIDARSMDARLLLAVWLHDRQDYQGAADLVGELCDALQADAQAKKRLVEEIETRNSSGVMSLKYLLSRREYYLACVCEANQDYEQQRRHLSNAIQLYEEDPDSLIAMYRSPGADEDFRQRTRALIRKAAKQSQLEIEQFSSEERLQSRLAASRYNEWAWLVANTEGDQKLAVEYSKRSLELRPEEPSYLDTLARCYFAVGDLENAVKAQRRAVELAPHYNVMRRQLEQFESAAQKAATAD